MVTFWWKSQPDKVSCKGKELTSSGRSVKWKEIEDVLLNERFWESAQRQISNQNQRVGFYVVDYVYGWKSIKFF